MIFDASSAEPEKPLADVLGGLEHHDSLRGLERALDAVEDMVARWEEKSAGKPIDPDIVADLSAAVSREDAPTEYQSIRRRVAEGRLTWDEFWWDPTAVPGGLRLLHETIRLNAVRLDQMSRELREEPLDFGSPEFRTKLREAEAQREQQQRTGGSAGKRED